jgi:hypothetical protein
MKQVAFLRHLLLTLISLEICLLLLYINLSTQLLELSNVGWGSTYLPLVLLCLFVIIHCLELLEVLSIMRARVLERLKRMVHIVLG